MRNRGWTVAAIALGLAASGGAAVTPPTGIQRVSWLQGCWQTQQGERTVEEQWMTPRGRSMLGMSRTTRGEELVTYELVVLRERGDGLAYEANPSGQAPAVFLSSVIAENRIVFENAQHDFPQRIGYERKGADLLAWIEGTRNGQARRLEFPYQRAVCATD
jgi:Domain of unknown function (DUF6265)